MFQSIILRYISTLALSARKSAEYEKKFQVAKIFSRPFALFAKKSRARARLRPLLSLQITLTSCIICKLFLGEDPPNPLSRQESPLLFTEGPISYEKELLSQYYIGNLYLCRIQIFDNKHHKNVIRKMLKTKLRSLAFFA